MAIVFILMGLKQPTLVFTKECLECYQCSSSTNVSIPLCDDEYFWFSPHVQRESYVQGCPPFIPQFCIKKEVTVKGVRHTQRGCIPGKDSKGNKIINGCMVIQNISADSVTSVCFCDRPKCNGSKRQNCGYEPLFSLVTIVVLNWFEF